MLSSLLGIILAAGCSVEEPCVHMHAMVAYEQRSSGVEERQEHPAILRTVTTKTVALSELFEKPDKAALGSSCVLSPAHGRYGAVDYHGFKVSVR